MCCFDHVHGEELRGRAKQHTIKVHYQTGVHTCLEPILDLNGVLFWPRHLEALWLGGIFPRQQRVISRIQDPFTRVSLRPRRGWWGCARTLRLTRWAWNTWTTTDSLNEKKNVGIERAASFGWRSDVTLVVTQLAPLKTHCVTPLVWRHQCDVAGRPKCSAMRSDVISVTSPL